MAAGRALRQAPAKHDATSLAPLARGLRRLRRRRARGAARCYSSWTWPGRTPRSGATCTACAHSSRSSSACSPACSTSPPPARHRPPPLALGTADMLPATSVQILLVVSGFITAVACILAVLSRRAQVAERRRLRRKMLGINDQYRLMRQELREAEDGRGRLQRELSKSEDSRRELDLLCQNLEEEIRRLRETRPAPLQRELELTPPVSPAPESAAPAAPSPDIRAEQDDDAVPAPGLAAISDDHAIS